MKDEEKITVLLSQRDRYFASMQTAYDQAKKCLAILRNPADITDADKSQLSIFVTRMDHVERTYKSYDVCMDSIESLNVKVEANLRQDTVQYMTAFEELYYAALDVLGKVNNFLNPSKPQSQANNVLDLDASHSTSHPRNAYNQLKLPRISIPDFDGKLDDWPNFYSLFSSLVHEETAYSPCEKFHCLKTYLKGEPLDAVNTLKVTDANYYIAWDNLVKQYQNIRLLAGHYIGAMLDFRPISECNIANLTRFIKVFKTNVNALGVLNINKVEDVLFLHIAVRNLDIASRRAFERQYADKDIPTHADLIQFVEEQRSVLQVTSDSPTQNRSPKPGNGRNQNKGKSKTFTVSKTASYSCPACSDPKHRLYACSQFKSLPVEDRIKLVASNNLCMNCTGSHSLNACKSTTRCQFCKAAHHGLLHNDSVSQGVSPSKSLTGSSPGSSGKAAAASLHTARTNSSEPVEQHIALLSTAVISLIDSKGIPQRVRILIDQGSMVNIITHSCAKRLGLKVRRSNRGMTTLGGNIQHSEGYVECILRPSHTPEPTFNTTAFVIPQITDYQPQYPLDTSIKERFSNLVLADPDFDKPAPIDFLLGVELFASILNDTYSVIKGEPTAISTCFGWILVGKISTSSRAAENNSVLLTCCQLLDENLKRFWESETVSSVIPPNPEDEACEAIFASTHYRLQSGRYVVKLPFKNRPPSLPNSRDLALKRFTSLEARMKKKPELSATYHSFMKEYLELGHMVSAPSKSCYVIPHHVVLKHDSVTTKLRTVFDASFKPQPNGPSLNTELMNGPKLQRDLADILCGFRRFKVVICSDLKMCYRQILVDPADRQYQHIFYRSSPSVPTTEYELCTVTYGLKPSSFLSSRVLLQLTHDEGSNYPLACQAIRKQCYVDDICAGTDDLHSALQLRHELVELLKKGGFELRKWYSNFPSALEGIPQEHRNQPLAFLPVDDLSLKILGILYDPTRDIFSYSVDVSTIRPSKRGVYSEVSRIFDPLGWITPSTFLAKCLIQKIWQRGLHWDELLPDDLVRLWRNFVEPLPLLRSLQIPRHIPINESEENRVYAFCDASDNGYAAVIYVTTKCKGDVSSHLLKARSKVAPLQVQSTPRLELCGALLLANMVSTLKEFFEELKPISISLFCDSTVVLAWLRTPPHLLKTYVANRVVRILQLTEPHQWHHVRSAANPADSASRGLTASELIKFDLWWKGPAFILNDISPESCPLVNEGNPQYITELKVTTANALLVTAKARPYVELLEHYSSLSQAKRIFGYVLRFIHNWASPRDARRVGPLRPEELLHGLFALVRVTQRHHYEKDLKLISNGKPPLSKQLRKLTAFLDDEGMLRVGGRIDQAPLPYNTRHPIIIPQKSRLADLIIAFYHNNSLHGGTRIMTTLIHRRFWITSLRAAIRKCLIKCKTCYLPAAKPLNPIMAELPTVRLEGLRPFSVVAIDFAGPFIIKTSIRRNAPHVKGYLAVFVCLEIKAVHFELAADLSTEGFLRVLDRFVARRGICRKIYCDRGTNFVGAARHLDGVYEMLAAREPDILNHLAGREIQWHFNPAAAPHFNGIAEAGVKSAKLHLNKVLGNQVLTYEELYTIIVRVEAVLNSRPLGALSADPRDSDYLTPGHFLVGVPLLAVPEGDLSHIPEGRLSRFQLIQQCIQSFWNRWMTEYLPTLIPRTKWTEAQDNIKLDDVVFMRKERTPPLQWPIGRVAEIFPGKDGAVRVVRIETASGSYLRPVHNLVPLPKVQ